jgi:hypothetical protein
MLLTVKILQLPAFTSLLSGEYPANQRTKKAWGSSLYSLGADPTENTASNSFYIIVTGGCLARARISLTCLPAATKQRMFLLRSLHSKDTTCYNIIFGCDTAQFRIYVARSRRDLLLPFLQRHIPQTHNHRNRSISFSGTGKASVTSWRGIGSYRWNVSTYTSQLDGVEVCFTLRLPYPTVKRL